MTIYPIADSRLADHNFIFIYVLKNIVFARGEDSNWKTIFDFTTATTIRH